LTLCRLGLGVAFPLLPVSWRLGAFLVAAATEALDGALARLLRVTSTFGQVLDPIADKVFVLAVLVTLAVDGPLAWWMIPLVVARDVLVLVGGLWVALRHGPSALSRMPPTTLGKLTTGAQFLLMLSLLVRLAPDPSLPDTVLLIVTATLSLLAGLDYLRRFQRP
jgi:CDP-diacylglycerol--glycerol-3-phosphate 3-phosphatidyltransferase